MMGKAMQIGLIGFGNIGAGVARTLTTNADLITSRSPRPLELAAIADLDTETKRDAPYDPAILTADVANVIGNPEIEVVIELIGGIEPARTFVEKALSAGQHVVTANKALMSKHGPELLEVAAKHNVGLLFEAAIGGGIPIIRALEQGLCANEIHSIAGIINGTANYILTQMEDRDIEFGQALEEAQEAGYAEADPTFDIEGNDTQHKIAVLASLVFGMDVRGDDVWVEGITAIQPLDIHLARELGYVIKLLGIAKRAKPGDPAEIRVHPTLVPADSQLAAVRGVYNAILVDGEPIGPTLFYGQGAGPEATSSAIVSDLMALAADTGGFNAARDARLRIPMGEKSIRLRDELRTHYYLRFTVKDQPGTMAELSGILASHAISIESMIQHKTEDSFGADVMAPVRAQAGPGPGTHARAATITIVTHEAEEKQIRTCLEEVGRLTANLADPLVLRVEE